MKAAEELQTSQLVKYLLFTCMEIIYVCCFLPPLRKLFLTILGSRIGKDTIIMHVSFFNWYHKGPGGLTIGNECFIGDQTLIDLYNSVEIGNQVTIAQRVTILTHINVGYKDHPLQEYFPKKSEPVIIKNGAVIGAASTILSGVTIGEKSLVAAGSIVTKDVPAQTLVAGNPAKIIRKIQ